MSRIEIVAPERQRRAFALTVTADSRDEGFPSSCSAAVDQISSGAEEDGKPSRLLIISAGNTSADGRQNYSDHNHTQGVEDPAQSWNALSVGAFTEKAAIYSDEYRDWKPIANAGQLSPASRTSVVWDDRSWPIKPDIVMEGGNLATDPTTGNADYVDDLMLLTTRTSPTGALLTTTGDTSAATALAARYAALIWSRYVPQIRCRGEEQRRCRKGQRPRRWVVEVAQGLSLCAIAFLSKADFSQTLRSDESGLAVNAKAATDVNRSDVTAHQAYFNSAGRLEVVYFPNSYGSPVSDPSGVFGQRYLYDQHGMVTKTTNLGSAGIPEACLEAVEQPESRVRWQDTRGSLLVLLEQTTRTSIELVTLLLSLDVRFRQAEFKEIDRQVQFSPPFISPDTRVKTESLRQAITQEEASGMSAAFAPVNEGYGLQLIFAEPLKLRKHGPLCLGYAAHYGLGLFIAVDKPV